MTDRAALWEAAATHAGSGHAAALATVARHRGSLPMSSDAKMLITPQGRYMGTVGGGCVEADVIREAIATMARGQPTFVTHALNAEVAGDLGLSCGGTVDLFVEPVPPTDEMATFCTQVAHGIRDRLEVAVVTAIDWNGGPAKRALVGDSDHQLGRPIALGDVPWHRHRSNTFVLDEHSLFVERIPRRPRVIIFGAGHVGREIARLASAAGFYVFLTDDRADFANRERVPDADEIIVGSFHEVLDGLRVDSDDYVLAVTRGHAFDANIIERTAASPARFVGMLGSKRKRSVIWKALSRAGVSSAALARVQSPIGIEIGADTPAEIAVSVVAELIRVRRLGKSSHQSR